MSFCRITGKSRGLPKPNYFPLLAPISPADAKRCCRITTKSQGLPGHHFIPALLGVKPPRQHCRVTAKSEGLAPHHFPDIEGSIKPHSIIPGYKYVVPLFDEEQKQQKLLLKLLSQKISPADNGARYVYPVDEKSTGLVLSGELEAAVRDGDVRDVMLDKDGDTMLVKLLRGPNITIDVKTLVVEDHDVLWDGWGPNEEVIKERQKEEKEAELMKKKRQGSLVGARKIFEEKEKIADIEENENKKLKTSKMMKMKMKDNEALPVVETNGTATLIDNKVVPEKVLEPVFGHIVQTATGVEFFPTNKSVDLPKGKVIPGQLIKNGGIVKFVPGMQVEGRFVPGQTVTTNNGEQFVPGQVIETIDGPKFVPGQVVETSSGSKFVPGQTVQTENGPQFVPGQIIETKVGPTFIPGQIIFTEDKARFVPGRVVETTDGPRFVPGRVIETGSAVTFVSGQVVDTPDGLKFVAPDLEDDEEGCHEFSVQGFEVTPEELKLFRPTHVSNSSELAGNMIIDSSMLKQMAEAGMSVGRQVPAELPSIDIRSLPEVLEKFQLEGLTALKMSRVLTCLGQAVKKINFEADVCTSNIEINNGFREKLLNAINTGKDIDACMKVLIASAVANINQLPEVTENATLAAIGNVIDRALGEKADIIPMNGIVCCLEEYLSKPQNLQQVITGAIQHLTEKETNLDRLHYAISKPCNPIQAVKKLSLILKDTMGDAFQKISSQNPDLVHEVLQKLKETDGLMNTNEQVIETVQKAIVGTVREQSEQCLKDLMKQSRESSEGKEFKELLLQSVGLAKALGLPQVATILLDVVSDAKNHEVLASDPTIMDILERLTVMRQFAELKPELSTALKILVSDPELARADPRLRELVRESAALMVVPEESLQTSTNIPASLLFSDNSLAMEVFLAKTRRPKTLLILKHGIQAVVPREASRAVITGQVPYAVLDEKGIRYFEPMHLFSTMKLPKYAAHCFSMYCCAEVEPDSGLATPVYSTPRSSVCSLDELPLYRGDWERESFRLNRKKLPLRPRRRDTIAFGHNLRFY